MANAKIYISGATSHYYADMIPDVLKRNYPEFQNVEEVGYDEQIVDENEDDENDNVVYVQYMFEGIWNGDPEELYRMTHHAEAIYEETELDNCHVEVCYNEEWFGGDDHIELED